MYNKCCVVSCASRRKDVNFHMFPKTEIGLKKWLQSINCEKLGKLSYQELRKQFICRKHFENRFLASTGDRARLLRDAYPTLFTESEIASGIPHTSLTSPDETENFDREHNYVRKRQHVDHTYFKAEVVEKRCRIQTETDVMSLSSHIDNIESKNLPSTSRHESENTRELKISDDVAPSTPKRTPLFKRRRRVILTKNKLTPKCSRLYKEYAKSRRQLNFVQRAKRALKFSKTKSFNKLSDKMNPLAKKFVWMQIKQCTKKPRGRRFSDEEKLIALSIMKQSPKCYRFLHKIFILPSKYTLNKMIAQLNIEAGINDQIFDAVKQEVNTWDEKKKYCSIIFDEVALEAALTYEKHRDVICGT